MTITAVSSEDAEGFSVAIDETTWKMLEAYNALKTMNIKQDTPELDSIIGRAVDAMYDVLRELLSQDLLIG